MSLITIRPKARNLYDEIVRINLSNTLDFLHSTFSLRQRKERKKSKQRKEKVKEYTLDIKKKSRRRQNSGRIALVLNRLTRPAPSYR